MTAKRLFHPLVGALLLAFCADGCSRKSAPEQTPPPILANPATPASPADEVAQLLKLARDDRAQHRWAEASDDLRHAQELAPNDPEVRRSAELLARLEKSLPAIRELDARIALTPNDDQLLTDRALLFLRASDPEMALADATAATKLAPWAMRPRLFQILARQDLSAEPSTDPERLDLANLTPEFLETLARHDSEISLERDNAQLYISRAWELNEIGQPTLALEDAASALEKNPESAAACAEKSYALAKLGRADEAYAAINNATELDDKFSIAWNYRGELEMARADFAAGAESFSRALALEQTATGLQQREQCYRKLGQLEKADADHRAADALRGGQPD
ncbi:MAG: hypothetical protein ACR2HH_17165 [Chthoniobacterales bacterium]